MEISNYCVGSYHVLCVVFKVIVRAVLVRLLQTLNCVQCIDVCYSMIKANLQWPNFNNLLAPKTLSVTEEGSWSPLWQRIGAFKVSVMYHCISFEACLFLMMENMHLHNNNIKIGFYYYNHGK